MDAVVVGAGQAGLATSYHLTRHGIEHVVLERGDVANTWRTERWDGFCLNTPRFSQRLPGLEYRGPDPDGFSSLEETLRYFDEYAALVSPPVRTGVEVTAVRANSGLLELETDDELLRATNVVVATGAYQRPAPTSLRTAVPQDVFQLNTSDYRRPEELPEGSVLLIGGGQSGCQISDELMRAGRTVYLSVGRCPWLPRRYRGREILYWLEETGYMDQTVDTLPSPAVRLRCNAPISGNDGGHDCHPRWLAARGATLLGRLREFRDDKAVFAPDLEASLAFGGEACMDVLAKIDAHILESGVDVPPPEAVEPERPLPEIEVLDLHEEGISTVLWSNGFRPDFGWIDLPLFDDYGWPRQQRGITAFPGLYFVGLHWLHKRKSSLLFGVGEDAEHVAAHLAARNRRS